MKASETLYVAKAYQAERTVRFTAGDAPSLSQKLLVFASQHLMTTVFNQPKLAVVADPDQIDREAIGKSLVTHFNVRTVASVEEAWNLIVTLRPAAVVVALQWPNGLDWGLTLIEKARDRRDLDTTVIVGTMTAKDNARRIKALQNGADDCVIKPLNLTLLPFKLLLFARTRVTIGRYR